MERLGSEESSEVKARLLGKGAVGSEVTSNIEALRRIVGHISFHGGDGITEEEAGRLLESCEDDHKRFCEQQGIPYVPQTVDDMKRVG